ncbi:MAG: type IV pili twitching motility protein PilT [Elusimicrobia bacterium CG08_land_8_20_14_0_20_51_18]|nr:MAG: type IV pili twitching motility protein PilT [Elusimicrobia bacterium CG08_land_8_20_14_0_20_51_18]
MAITLNLLLKLMIQNKASDLHIRGDGPVFLRLNGDLTPINASNMTSAQVNEIAAPLLSDRHKKIFAENREVDFSYELPEFGRFRFNYFIQKNKPAIAVRHIPFVIPTFEDLKLPVESIKKLLLNERGLLLVTGITGSGKSSTLAAMLEFLNSTWEAHIITIEDPLEFVFRDKKSIISQREIGFDTNSFVDALRAAMRQDPDIIMVGEMRDLETTKAAITAAETGHLVLATMHTLNAVQTISRIIDLYPPHQQTQVRMQLSETLRGIVSQRLLVSSKGGRLPAVEIMASTPHIKKMIAENSMDPINQAIAKGAFYGMQTFNQSLVSIYKQGLAKLEDVISAASNPDDVLLAIKGVEQEIEPHK